MGISLPEIGTKSVNISESETKTHIYCISEILLYQVSDIEAEARSMRGFEGTRTTIEGSSRVCEQEETAARSR